MLKKVLKYTYYVAVFLSLALTMGFVVVKHNVRPVNDLKIEILDSDSLKFIDADMLKNYVLTNNKTLLERSRDSIDISAIENSLEKIQQVKNAEVFIDINGTMVIELTQLMPVARVFKGNESFYIDENGDKMPLSDKFTKAVPIVNGNVKEENLSEIYAFISYLRSNSILNELIVSVNIDKYNNYSLRTAKGNQVLEIGKPVNLEEKFEKLLIFYSRTVSEFGWQRYGTINLEFANQIVCTKR